MNGGYICEWDPFVLKLQIPRRRGVVSIVVWNTSNLIVFLEQVGDKMIYVYDSETKSIWDVVKFEKGVQSLWCVGDHVCVDVGDSVLVYRLPSLQLYTTLDTIASPIVGWQESSLKMIGRSQSDGTMVQLGDTKWKAHENNVIALAVRREDQAVATVSEKGTMVRVWRHGKKLWEGRRGLEPARVVSMDLHKESLVLATKKGSIHAFNLSDQEKRGILWNEYPKSRYVWYVGEYPMVQIQDEKVYIADDSGVITIGSLESGEVLFQTSLQGDSASPFTIH